MNEHILQGARRTPFMVNRINELEKIHQAIFQPQASCELIFVRSPGGLGKSRLAEEVLWRCGNVVARQERGPIPAEHTDWDWTLQNGKTVAGNLLDMTNANLHTRAHLMHAIRDALVWEENDVAFNNYDVAFARFQRISSLQGEYTFIQEAEQKAEKEFLRDYQANAKKQRLVLVFDTVERISLPGTQWLMEKGLINESDVKFYTFQWLADQIRLHGLPNTTILYIGRDIEGKVIFDQLEEAAKKSNGTCHLGEANPMPFHPPEAQAYFNALADYWQGEKQQQPQFERLSQSLHDLAQDKDRIQMLCLYTGGKPVHLALYADLLVEGRSLPEPLQDSYAQALIRVGAPSDGKIYQDKLEQVQYEIEEAFIAILFDRPTLRGEILKALVRAPRGLSFEQLYFILSSAPDETPKEWKEDKEKNQEKVNLGDQIQAELQTLRYLSIIKTRPDKRLGLQDEIYRIYANHLSGDERKQSGEQKDRTRLYRKLRAWADYQKMQYEGERANLQKEDERQLYVERPSMALKSSLILGERDESERVRIKEMIASWELETVHYDLLLDLGKNINHILFELGDRRWLANDEEAEALLQTELWQVLRDRLLQKFICLDPWPALKVRGEGVIEALDRVAQQDDVTRWIKRFVTRKQYERAIKFCDDVENYLQSFPEGQERHSWLHTFAHGERQIWRNYARTLSGMDTRAALKEMGETLADLKILLSKSQDEWAFESRREKGFLGHPAETRLRRVLAIGYNFIGYGYSTLGHFLMARTSYGMALQYMRETEFKAQQATTRNNLSRVLSERGYSRARRVCQDGLALRKEQGAEVPIAYSLNTLALIDNDHLRPDLAWREAAEAMAYFRRAEEPRGQGLALLQLGEALRRVARSSGTDFSVSEERPEILLQTAEQAITQAMDLFTDSPAAGEPMRLVEARIEMGCLQRDRIEGSDRSARHYQDALYYLDQAARKAKELGNSRLELDARVNIAWAHYYSPSVNPNAFQEVRTGIKQILEGGLLPKDCRILEGQEPPSSNRDDHYVYQQLSKMHGLLGRVEMDSFTKCAREIEASILIEEIPNQRRETIHKDSVAQGYLKEAAKNFVLALAYAQLLSPRSTALSIVYDTLYGYLKKFNQQEMDDFCNYEQEARQRFRTKEIVLQDLGNLDEFLEDCFGRRKEGC